MINYYQANCACILIKPEGIQKGYLFFNKYLKFLSQNQGRDITPSLPLLIISKTSSDDPLRKQDSCGNTGCVGMVCI